MVLWDPTFGLGDVIMFVAAALIAAYFFLRITLPRIRRSMMQATYYELQDAANFSVQLKNLTSSGTLPPPPAETKPDTLVPM